MRARSWGVRWGLFSYAAVGPPGMMLMRKKTATLMRISSGTASSRRRARYRVIRRHPARRPGRSHAGRALSGGPPRRLSLPGHPPALGVPPHVLPDVRDPPLQPLAVAVHRRPVVQVDVRPIAHDLLHRVAVRGPAQIQVGDAPGLLDVRVHAVARVPRVVE